MSDYRPVITVSREVVGVNRENTCSPVIKITMYELHVDDPNNIPQFGRVYEISINDALNLRDSLTQLIKLDDK